MKHKLRGINFLLPILIVSLSGCATLNKEECLTANWHDIGYEDGLKGYKRIRIGDHRKACAEHGVTPNLESYLQGRSLGLLEYCQPENGFTLGTSGRSYNNVCPHNMETGFKEAYNAGREIYDFEKKIKTEKKDLENLEEEIHSLEKEIKIKETQLNQACKNKDQCRAHLNQIRKLDRKKSQKKIDAGIMREAIKAMRMTLKDMQYQSTY